MFKKLILFLFAVMSFSYVDANEANLHKAKLLFTSYFEEFKTLEAKFVQHIFDENNIFSESMEGSFYVERPNKFRWHYMKPYEQIFVADGLNFYSYDVDLEQIIIKPQEQIYDQSQVILFLNDNRLLEYYKIEKASLEQDILWVTLRSINSNQMNNEFKIGFNDGLLSQISLIDTIGQTISIIFDELKTDETISSTLFTIDIPVDVDVIGQPLIID